MKMETAAHYITLPAPNRTYILLQTTSLEADTLARIPSLNTGFHVAARASPAQPGLRFSAPVTTHGLLGLPYPFRFQLWEALVVRAGLLFWSLLSHQLSGITLPVWLLRPSLSHK